MSHFIALLLQAPDVSGLLVEMMAQGGRREATGQVSGGGQEGGPGRREAPGQVSGGGPEGGPGRREATKQVLSLPPHHHLILAPTSPQIAEVLSKLVRMIGEVAAEARKRAPLVAMVSELEEARGELAWVAEWEHDEQRYKVRGGGFTKCVMPKVSLFELSLWRQT